MSKLVMTMVVQLRLEKIILSWMRMLPHSHFGKSKMSHKVGSPCLYFNCKARCGCGPDAICCSPTCSMGDFSSIHPVHGLLEGKDLFLVHCRGGNLEQGMQKTCDTLFLMQRSMFPILSSFRPNALEFNYKREFWALWMGKPFKDSWNFPPLYITI